MKSRNTPALAANKESGSAPAPAKPAAAPKQVKQETFAIRDDIPVPEIKNQSKFPFADLEVGKSFGVTGRNKKSFNSIIYSQHERYSEPVIDPETGEPKKRTKTNRKGETSIVNETRRTREFVAHDVDPAKDVDGATVRIFRVK